mmetsp:Transcript_15964/g.43205  ORF Transcript_15964/g.43205 Transcript_15964/m.43205 type:complete len:258 (+) Transcript_15964:574-1347(+)
MGKLLQRAVRTRFPSIILCPNLAAALYLQDPVHLEILLFIVTQMASAQEPGCGSLVWTRCHTRAHLNFGCLFPKDMSLSLVCHLQLARNCRNSPTESCGGFSALAPNKEIMTFQPFVLVSPLGPFSASAIRDSPSVSLIIVFHFLRPSRTSASPHGACHKPWFYSSRCLARCPVAAGPWRTSSLIILPTTHSVTPGSRSRTQVCSTMLACWTRRSPRCAAWWRRWCASGSAWQERCAPLSGPIAGWFRALRVTSRTW